MKKLILGAMLLVALLGAVALLIIGRDRGLARAPESKVDSGPAVLDQNYDPGQAADWNGPLPAEIVEQFFNATTHSERLKFLRDPDQNAELMDVFFRDGPGARERILGVTYVGPVTMETMVLEGFRVVLDNGTTRLLGVVLTPDGGVVDFRSYARHSSKSWADLLEGTATEAAEVRVYLKPAFAFFGSYSDDAAWLNYVASSPDLENPLYFYANQGSKAAEALAGISTSGQMVTLAIRSVEEGHQRRQFEVTEVLSLDWVMPTMPSGIEPRQSAHPLESRSGSALSK